MPKRVPTPPPSEDEPRYLTIVHPYAISGTCNMELPKDRQDFARWVACCIDKDAFFAMFHKPSSRGMVVIEVDRNYAHLDRILGEHRWSEFLLKPSKEEMGRTTQVFFCSYSTGRHVQKYGWKRIDVDEAWFKSWTPNNRHIKFPYPQTYFCEVPVEDRTNHSMCRPLPGVVKPAPTPELIVPQTVVGSAAWIESREGGVIAVAAKQNKQSQLNKPGAWGKGAPKPWQAASAKPNPTAAGSVKKPIQTGTRLPAVGGGPVAVKSSNVFAALSGQSEGKKPPVPVAGDWEDSPPASRGNTPVLRGISPPMTRKNTWGGIPSLSLGTATSSAQDSADRVGNMSAASWDSAGVSTPSPDSDSGPDPATATESDNPYAVQIRFSESMEEEFHGMGIRALEGDDEDGELEGLDAMAPFNTWEEPTGANAWGTVTGGWDDDPLDAEGLWQQTQAAPKPVLCTAHGIICKKGICAEYAHQLRQIKRAQEAEERKAALANKSKKGNNGRGKGKKNNGRENKNIANDDANANGNPFRGPGAPVRTNWRGAPRAIVDADTIAQETKAALDDGWDNSDSENEPNVAMTAVVSDNVGAGANVDAADAASNASWGLSEGAYDPWASPPMTATKTGSGTGKNGKKSKPVSSNWAEQVEAELGSGPQLNNKTDAGFKRPKRGKSGGAGSATSWGTNTSGKGTNAAGAASVRCPGK